MGFRLARDAAQDIREIAEFGIENFGIDAARAYHSAMFSTFDLIAQNPRMARRRDEITPPVRVHRFQSHLVIYEIDDSGVVILRVRHGSEDWISDPV